jgi:hypothetical protein
MNPDEIRELLTEIRDTNRQLVEVQQQIAQSIGRYEEMYSTQMQKSMGLVKHSWVLVLIPLLIFLIPMFLKMFR